MESLRHTVEHNNPEQNYLKLLMQEVGEMLEESEQFGDLGLLESNQRKRREVTSKTILELEGLKNDIEQFKQNFDLGGEVYLGDTKDLVGVMDLVREKRSSLEKGDYQKILGLFEKLSHSEAKLDQMTGLYSRREFFNQMENLLDTQAENKKITLVSVDIDFFKSFNEISHLFGDMAIKTVADAHVDFCNYLLTRSTIKASPFRYGGEEFLLSIEIDDQAQVSPDQFQQMVGQYLKDWIVGLEKKYCSGKPDIQKFLRDKTIEKKKDDVNVVLENNQSFAFAKAEITKHSLQNYIENIDRLKPVDLIRQIENLLQKKKNLKTHDRHKFEFILNNILKVETGTASVGVLVVDCGDFKGTHNMLISDKEALLSWLNGEHGRGYVNRSQFQLLFGDDFISQQISYHDFYQKIESKLLTMQDSVDIDSTKLKFGLTNIKHILANSRTARMATAANAVVEQGKKQARNKVFDYQSVSFKDIDQQNYEHSARSGAEKEINLGYIERKKNIRIELDDFHHDQETKKFQTFDLRNCSQIKKDICQKISPSDQETLRYLANIIETQTAELFFELISQLDLDEKRIAVEIKKYFLAQQEKYTESLTGSYNEKYVFDVLEAEAKKFIKNNKSWSLCAFDFDNLKIVNDGPGCNHDLGDVVLLETVYLIEGGLSDDSWVAEQAGLEQEEYVKLIDGARPTLIRVTGGEEFMVSYPGLSGPQSKKIQQAMAKMVFENTQSILRGKKYKKQIKSNLLDQIQTEINNPDNEVYGKRSQKENQKIGSLTSVVLDVQEWLVNNREDVANFDILDLRLMLDKIGEHAKNILTGGFLGFDKNGIEPNIYDQETYRGFTLSFKDIEGMHLQLAPQKQFADLIHKYKALASEYGLLIQNDNRTTLDIANLKRHRAEFIEFNNLRKQLLKQLEKVNIKYAKSKRQTG